MKHCRHCALNFLAVVFLATGPDLSHAATREGPPGSGCHSLPYSSICKSDPGGIACGLIHDIPTPLSPPHPPILIIFQDLEGNEKDSCTTTVDIGCVFPAQPEEWVVAQIELKCGNGSRFWGELVRIHMGQVEWRSYTIDDFVDAGIKDDKAIFALGQFRALVGIKAPFTPAQQKGPK